MRHTPEAIRQFLDEQPRSGQAVSDFCDEYDLKILTFYSWKRKYNEVEAVVPEGFCKIRPKREVAERSLRLPSRLQLTLTGLSLGEITELILKIDRAHA
jgi:hypothetical protein